MSNNVEKEKKTDYNIGNKKRGVAGMDKEKFINSLTKSDKVNIFISQSGLFKLNRDHFLELSFENIDSPFSLYLSAISLNDSLVRSYICAKASDMNQVHIASSALKDRHNLNTISCNEYLNYHFLNIYYDTLKKKNLMSAIEIELPNQDMDIEYYCLFSKKLVLDNDIKYLVLDKYINKEKLNIIFKKRKYILRTENLNEIFKAIKDNYDFIITSDTNKINILNAIGENITIDEIDSMVSKAIDNILFKKNVDNSFSFNNYVRKEELFTLLKNDDILPLAKENELTFISNTKSFSDMNIRFDLLLKDTDLNIKYLCRGYDNLSALNLAQLRKDAVIKAVETKICVVVLGNTFNRDLPQSQISLLEDLKLNGVKVIAFVYAYQYVDDAIYDLCDAILTFNDLTLLDINISDMLLGKTSPSAKTLWVTPLNNKVENNLMRYPLGYGLTYGKVEVLDAKVDFEYYEIVVKNSSDYRQKFNLFLYILEENRMISTISFYLDKHEVNSFRFKLDLNDLNQYDFENHRFNKYKNLTLVLKDGGEILSMLNINNNLEDEKDELFDKDDILNDETNTYQNIKISIKRCRIIGTIIFIYILVMSIMMFAIFMNHKMNIGSIISLLVGFVSIVIYCVYMFKIKKLKPTTFSPKNYSDIIENFKTVDKEDDLNFVVKSDSNNENDEEDKTDKTIRVENKKNLKTVAAEIFNFEEIHSDYQNLSESNFEEVDEDYEYIDVPNEELNYLKLVTDFKSYLLTKGLNVSQSQLAVIFAGFFGTNELLIHPNDSLLFERFVLALEEYLNNHEIVIDVANKTSFEELIREDSSATKEYFDIAKDNDKYVQIALVKGATNDNYGKIFRIFREANMHRIRVRQIVDGIKYDVRRNMILLVDATNLTISADEYLNIDLDILETKPSQGAVSTISLETSQIIGLIKAFRDTIYFPEDDYKKFDQLVETIGDKDFTLSNRTTVDIDQMTVLLTLQNVSKEEIVDIFLRTRIMPCIFNTETYKKDNGDFVVKTLNRIFNEDTIPLTMRLLKKVRDSKNE